MLKAFDVIILENAQDESEDSDIDDDADFVDDTEADIAFVPCSKVTTA